jgi:hypothetical protein
MKHSIAELIEKCPFLSGGCIPCLPDEKDYVIINGLKWDKDDLVIGNKESFNFSEASLVAAAKGKRLPTEEEFIALHQTPFTWDERTRETWFGDDRELRSKSKHSISFPIMINRTMSIGIYWSSTIYKWISHVTNGEVRAYIFESWGTSFLTGTAGVSSRCSVRCVSE